MTTQISDELVLEGRSTTIQGVNGEGLFHPEQLGWKTQMISTACWRGFYARYDLVDARLVLTRLSIQFELGFLTPKEPVFLVEIDDGSGQPVRHRVVGLEVTLGPPGDGDIELGGLTSSLRMSLRYDNAFAFDRTTLRSGEGRSVGPYSIRPILAAGVGAIVTADLPPLQGWAGRWRREDHGLPLAVYEGMTVPVDFTGGILACDGFIHGLGLHMGFHPAWTFEHVEELTFERGVLLDQEDVSEKLAEVRARLEKHQRSPEPGASHGEIEEWIERCFSLEY